MARSDEEIVDEIVRDEMASDEGASDGTDSTSAEPVEASDDGSLTDRVGNLFSLRAFLLSAVLIGVGVVGGGAIPLVGTVGSLGGLFVASFVIGLLTSERRYLETAVAGGGIVGVSFALSLLTSAVLPVGLQFFEQYGLAFAGVGVGLGAVIGVLGHYFGRDLRDGLTQEI